MTQLAPGLEKYLASGGNQVELRQVDDAGEALGALHAARDALMAIRHPEEFDDPLPSFVSAVEPGERGPTFWFDISDLESYDGMVERVIHAMAAALDHAAVGGLLAWPEYEPETTQSPERSRARSAGTIGIVDRTSQRDLGALLMLAESARPDGRSDVDLYRVDNTGVVKRVTIGRFLVQAEVGGDMTLAVGFDRETKSSFTRLYRVRADGSLGPVPDLGTPQCGSLSVSPDGHLAWASAGLTGWSAATTELRLRLAGTVADELIAVGEPGEPYRFEGRYMRFPSVRDDGTVAFLAGAFEFPEIRVVAPTGNTFSYTPPKPVAVGKVRLGPSAVIAIQVQRPRSDGDTRTVGLLDTGIGQIALVEETGWQLGGWSPTAEAFLAFRSRRVPPDWKSAVTEVAVLDPNAGALLRLAEFPFFAEGLTAAS